MEPPQIYFGKVPSCFLLSGKDARTFLHSQMTVGLPESTVGSAHYGLWLSDKGRVLADSWVYVQADDSCLIWSLTCPSDHLKETLESHLVADQVDVDDLREEMLFSFRENGLSNESAYTVSEVSETETAILMQTVFWNRSWSMLIAPESEHAPYHEQWRTVPSEASTAEIDHPAFTKRRIEAAQPAIPGDSGARSTPHEIRLDFLIDLQKGCFPGREILSHFKRGGKLNKSLQVLQWQARETLPALPLDVYADRLKVGQITSASQLGTEGLGLAMLRNQAMDRELKVVPPDGAPFSVQLRRLRV